MSSYNVDERQVIALLVGQGHWAQDTLLNAAPFRSRTTEAWRYTVDVEPWSRFAAVQCGVDCQVFRWIIAA